MFTKTLVDIIKSDAEVSRFEWVLVSVIKKHLTGNSLQKLSKGANKKIRSLSSDVILVLSMLAYSGAENKEQAGIAFAHALNEVGLKDKEICGVNRCNMESVHSALISLCSLLFVEKEKLLRACGVCVARDAAKNQALMNTPVTDFELSVRARNCLKKMQIRSLGDLLKISESELLSYKNFGETSLTEIKHMLTARGLRLGQGADGPTSQIHQDRYEELLAHTSEQVLSKPVSSLNLSVRARKALQMLSIQTVADLAIRTEAELLGIKNFGSTSLVEIHDGLAIFGLKLREID